VTEPSLSAAALSVAVAAVTAYRAGVPLDEDLCDGADRDDVIIALVVLASAALDGALHPEVVDELLRKIGVQVALRRSG
jgi:hypothetical protein